MKYERQKKLNTLHASNTGDTNSYIDILLTKCQTTNIELATGLSITFTHNIPSTAIIALKPHLPILKSIVELHHTSLFARCRLQLLHRNHLYLQCTGRF